MRKMHPVQLNTLHKLLFFNNLRHSLLKETSVANSQFKFHIEELIRQGLVTKTEKQYSLTEKGLVKRPHLMNYFSALSLKSYFPEEELKTFIDFMELFNY